VHHACILVHMSILLNTNHLCLFNHASNPIQIYKPAAFGHVMFLHRRYYKCFLSVDATFNLGLFSVTPVTYQNLLMEIVRNKSSPYHAWSCANSPDKNTAIIPLFCIYFNPFKSQSQWTESLWNRW